MEFDTKERTKFFAQAREHACAIGSGPRKGRSALRPCTPHASRHDMQRLFLIIDGVIPATKEEVEDAEQCLSRRGIHPHHRCTALANLVHCVIRWPGRLYFGLVGFDVMHILYLNWVKYLQKALLSTMTTSEQNDLNRRLLGFLPFRNPVDGTTCKKVTSLSKHAYSSAEVRVLHLFIWAHALGSKALLLKPELRNDALSAISSLQIICYTVRGKLSYTADEHRYDFYITLSLTIARKCLTPIGSGAVEAKEVKHFLIINDIVYDVSG